MSGTPSPRKKRTNSTPTRKPIDKKQILQQLVTPSGTGSNISVNSATEAPRKVKTSTVKAKDWFAQPIYFLSGELRRANTNE